MLRILPIEIMQKIFKYLHNESLVSCLFVNKYWCNCVVSLLWENPFKHELVKYPFSNHFPPVLRNFTHKKNRSMIVEAYLSCLDKEDESFLNYPNYPLYLKQLDYDDLENNVNLYLSNNCPDKEDEEIPKTVLKLILRRSKNLRTLTIRNRNGIPDLQNLSNNEQPGLFNLTNVKIDAFKNVNHLLKLISSNCNQIHYLDITVKKEDDDDIISDVANIIKVQNRLMEFCISFVKSHFDQIMFALLSQKSNLISIRLYDIMFNEVSNNLLREFIHVEDLSLIHCDGVF